MTVLLGFNYLDGVLMMPVHEELVRRFAFCFASSELFTEVVSEHRAVACPPGEIRLRYDCTLETKRRAEATILS